MPQALPSQYEQWVKQVIAAGQTDISPARWRDTLRGVAVQQAVHRTLESHFEGKPNEHSPR